MNKKTNISRLIGAVSLAVALAALALAWIGESGVRDLEDRMIIMGGRP